MFKSKDTLLEDIGIRIKSLRKANGMTQLDIASKSDIDVRLIQRLEAGKTDVQISTVYRVIEGFGMSLSQFFDAK
jgi:transcriptional regulator with XRE-family HTH domain